MIGKKTKMEKNKVGQANKTKSLALSWTSVLGATRNVTQIEGGFSYLK